MGWLLLTKIGVIIQCRDNSTRYEEKSVRPFFEGKSILEIIIEKFKVFDYPIVVATTKSSLKTIALCRMMGVECYPHAYADDNVAVRMFVTASFYGLDGFLRVCADNPFIDLGLMYPIVTWAETMNYDYVAFDNCMQRHEGFFLEYISKEALCQALNSVLSAYDDEHVTPYIIRHPEIFKQKILPIPPIMNKVFVRLTVDTEDDFKTAQEVYKNTYKKGYCSWHRVIEYIKENPEIEKRMLEGMRISPKKGG
jgi:spore coat polysaccharide biosynthesis protein SpsF